VTVGLEIDGNVRPSTPSSITARSARSAWSSAAIWAPTAKRNIAIATLERPFGDTKTDDLWVEIYAMRELRYIRLMKRPESCRGRS